MFDIYIFEDSIVREVDVSVLQRLGLRYSLLFDAVVTYRSGMEHIASVRDYIRRRISFGDLLEYSLPAEIGQFIEDHRGSKPVSLAFRSYTSGRPGAHYS